MNGVSGGESRVQYRATRIEIDLRRIEENVRVLKNAMNPRLLMAVVKANAYGHGLVPVSQAALKAGADYMAVALPEEGETLRANGISQPILVLGGVNEDGARASVENDLIQTVFEPRGVMQLEKIASAMKKKAQVHIKLDTGMGRIGVRNCEELRALLRALSAASNVVLSGAFTHFANADAKDDCYTSLQIKRLQEMLDILPPGLLCHAASSAAMLRYPETRLGMVRAGIAMYGYPPVKTELPLRPAFSWKTEVAFVKRIQTGECVSYGNTFTAKRPTLVATIPVGYGDGFRRELSGKAFVLIRGKRCPVIGRVCMDQTMIDATDIPSVCEGDEVVLLGTQGSASINAEEMAAWAGTISYEIFLAVTPRVPVHYINQP